MQERGSSLLEVWIALLIVSFAILAIGWANLNSLLLIKQGFNHTQALLEAEYLANEIALYHKNHLLDKTDLLKTVSLWQQNLPQILPAGKGGVTFFSDEATLNLSWQERKISCYLQPKIKLVIHDGCIRAPAP